jgi:hypothetical protein
MLTQVIVWLNALTNPLGQILLAPAALLPGWLSATLVSVVTGVLLLAVFKYTSRQRSIKAVRSDIKAHLLALKLFKDSPRVTLRAQGRVMWGACRLLALSIVPMLVMLLPVCLLLAQLALWYQSRPLKVGDEAVITVKLGGKPGDPLPAVQLQPNEALETTVGPVCVLSKREICWNVKATNAGDHRLTFLVDGKPVTKELAVGDGYMRVSTERPEWSWSDALLHPSEEPFAPDAPVQSITIDYPERTSWKILGIEPWILYWFAVSMVAGLASRRMLNVHI